MTLTRFAVGEPYPGAVPDGVVFDAWAPGGTTLRLGAPNWTAHELKAYWKGPLQFCCLTRELAIMTLWRFGHEPWIDAPFDACVARDAGVLVLQDLETAASRIAVQIHVIDTADGKLKVARLITLSPGATRELTTAIHAQLAAGHANFSAGFNGFNAHSTEALARLGT